MKQYKGLKRIVYAFFNSINGFKCVFKTEEAFVQEVYLCLFLTPFDYLY